MMSTKTQVDVTPQPTQQSRTEDPQQRREKWHIVAMLLLGDAQTLKCGWQCGARHLPLTLASCMHLRW